MLPEHADYVQVYIVVVVQTCSSARTIIEIEDHKD